MSAGGGAFLYRALSIEPLLSSARSTSHRHGGRRLSLPVDIATGPLSPTSLATTRPSTLRRHGLSPFLLP